ncbi:MAG: DUF362 domain-containing protein [Candidatus Saganbacteria bacterium]|nr:DUF362 domain-containing protein [Candidatus Saganbacteria bacterium]
MASKVFFTKELDQAAELFDRASLRTLISKGDQVALKIHFGEPGNHAYIKPERVKPLVRKVRDLGGKPFWTDANTLYKGKRSNNESHLQTAHNHGYTMNRTGADVIIADDPDNVRGLAISVNYPLCNKIHVAPRALVQAMLVITHFKGHELTGFGGALKNLGMGLGSKLGKLKMHQDCPNCPEVKTCKKNQTLESCWVGSSPLVQQKIAEYAAGIAAQFKSKIGFISFITDVSENCDCYAHNSAPIVPDIGILASFDPVALDQACVDLVNQSEGRIKGPDKFRTIWPEADWSIQLKHAESIDLGSRKYELIKI